MLSLGLPTVPHLWNSALTISAFEMQEACPSSKDSWQQLQVDMLEYGKSELAVYNVHHNFHGN